ncbi:NHL repeat-containing protein 2 [Blattella germanica]|nr:NHL repeat-containing protein 2 [Blattella germanica]
MHSYKDFVTEVYEAGICASIAGSGKEENRNNMYPHAAGFAQPSGLTLAPGEQAVFIADSESSSIRKMSLLDGKISAVVGGDRSPFNLFAFGDKDGKQFEARLQHPLGVTWCNQNQTLYVADSYNHKLKNVDIQRNFCSTLLGTGKPGSNTGSFEVAQLNEPGGLCVNTDGTRLYVADTNNHCVKVVELQEQQIEKLAIYLPSDHREPLSGKNKSGTVLPSEVKVNSSGGEINLSISVMLADGIKLTAIAPQKWALEFPDLSWSASCAGGEYAQDMSLRVLVPRRKSATHTSFCVNYRLFICLDETQCTMRNFHFQITVIYDDNAPALVQHQVSYEITP